MIPSSVDGCSESCNRGVERLWLYSAAAHGRSEAKDIEVQARQAPRAARDLGPARAGLPDVQAAEATSSRLPELQDVQGPGRRAAPHRRAVDTPDDSGRGRRAGRRPRARRDRRRRCCCCVRRDPAGPLRAAGSTRTALPLVEASEAIDDGRPRGRSGPSEDGLVARARRTRGRGRRRGRRRLRRKHGRHARRVAPPHPAASRRASARRSPS